MNQHERLLSADSKETLCLKTAFLPETSCVLPGMSGRLQRGRCEMGEAERDDLRERVRIWVNSEQKKKRKETGMNKGT